MKAIWNVSVTLVTQNPCTQAIIAGDVVVSPSCTILCIYFENILSSCYVQGPELKTWGVTWPGVLVGKSRNGF